MEETAEVRRQFEGPFGPPATQQQIEAAERSLGHGLPMNLKAHYAEYNGFKGPTNTDFLYTLDDLVRTTLWLRGEGYFPDFIQRSVALGDDGTGAFWLICIDQPDKVIDWDAEMEGEGHVVLDGGLAEEWIARKATYDDAAGT